MAKGGQRRLKRKEGYQFSAEQCRLRLKGLKSKYYRQKKENNNFGESTASDDD